jgi:hypothetical protein
MKKLLTTLLLSLTLLVGYAQNAVYARATTLNIGVKNNWTGEFEWAGPQVTENGVTIMIEKTAITINSQSPQHYTIYSDSENVEVEGSAVYWYAYDLTGQRCRLYLIENEVGDDFLAIEYNDFAWIYSLINITQQ